MGTETVIKGWAGLTGGEFDIWPQNDDGWIEGSRVIIGRPIGEKQI